MNSNAARWFSLILGILLLVCGVMMLFTPYEAYIMVAIFIPIAILVHGIRSIASYSNSKKEGAPQGWILADGILSAVIGIWLLFQPAAAAVSLPFIFGFWILFAGVLRLMGGFSGKDAVKGSGWLIVWGIIGIITGLLLLNHPLFTGVIISYLVIWAFIFIGIQDIFFFFVKKAEKLDL